MIFRNITLNNFRQFKGENTINFSSGKSITLIIGDNGVGKTTFLQAFRYCFYGESQNYLKLPNSEVLLNNQIIYELKELDKATLFVTVEFSHQGKNYIAKRSKEYERRNATMRPLNKGSFQLWESTEYSGMRPLNEEHSKEAIHRMLPPGLAHIYMFDGERMEKRIESKDYQDDLKEAITGILGLKKLENSISIIGEKDRSTKVAGLVFKLQTSSSDSDKKTLEEYQKLAQYIGDKKDKLNEIHLNLKEKKDELEKYREYQQSVTAHKQDLVQRDKIEAEKSHLESQVQFLSSDNIKNVLYSIRAKLLLETKDSFENVINKKEENHTFYQNLHIDTLNDIISKGRCICGTEIKPNTKEYLNVKSHEHSVLPYDNASHLNKITNEYNKTDNLNEMVQKTFSIKKDLVNLKLKLSQKEIELQEIILKIERDEKRLSRGDVQRQINALQSLILKYTSDESTYARDIQLLSKDLERKNKAVDEINKSSEYNRKVDYVLESLQRIVCSIKFDLKNQEDEARTKLEIHMNDVFKKVLVGNFTVKINHQFELEITQWLNNESDAHKMIEQKHTNILSTGQSVMVSLSFINSLLETLSDLKGDHSLTKHGIIMDAALSNVDEKHIVKVCDSVLNNFDQLIFLSFKRQLRNEFYYGIGSHIGKAYLLTKKSDGSINIEEKQISNLESFIHEMEEAVN